ncbi:MAG: hypothetical protein H7318_01100 [Oligoflexus sp.]|nr:hypothetical protein [Oligoflexus sp.]
MKALKIIKLSAAVVLILAIAFVIVSFLIPEIIPIKPLNTNRSYSQMSAYVAMLESHSQQNKSPLGCNASGEAGQNFQDQWSRELRCTMEEGSLYIRSAGPNGKFDNKDDLIVRRLLRKR